MASKIIYSAFYVWVVLCSGWLPGCSPISAYSKFQPHDIDNKPPINVSGKAFPEFDIAKIKSLLPPGADMGAYYGGTTKRWQHSYKVGDLINDTTEEGFFREGLLRELKEAGYKVSGAGGILFNGDSSKARFLVGAAIAGAELITFGPSADNLSEGRCRVLWEIYDKRDQKIIYKGETLGYAKTDGVNLHAFTYALMSSLRNLLASPEFVAAIERQLTSSLRASEDSPIRFYRLGKKAEKLNIDALTKAMISIKTEKGHGSGFLINPEGYAITSYHVIANSNVLSVYLRGNKPMEAEVIRTDPEKDLALVKLRGEEYDFLFLGNASDVKVGMDVYAIGSPLSLGLAGSVSKGVISGLRKLKDPDITLFQTDASVNPGNSGGPLINSSGEVIGIVALKLSAPGVEGLGFAVSINDAKRYLNLQEGQ
jgi:S1-C subfamily serine protease